MHVHGAPQDYGFAYFLVRGPFVTLRRDQPSPTTRHDALMQPQDPVIELGESSALLRADAVAVHAINRLYGGAPPLDLAVRSKSYRLHWGCEGPREGGPCDMYRFRLGTHAGCIGFDAPSIEALLGERRTDLLPRDLRYILLADALQAPVDALEKALRLRFEWAPPEAENAPAPMEPLHSAFFTAVASDHGETLQGFVQFDNAASFDALLPAFEPRPGTAPQVFDQLRLPVNFVLGHTQIRLREVSSIRPGDIIGIESWGSAGAALVVTADLGGPEGVQLTGLAEGSRITLQSSKDSPMNRDTPPALAADADANLPIDRLDALEVNLRFEVGELSLSLRELRNIRAGHVFDLAQPLNRCPVRIVAHGNVLGKGHLVAVGDRLGVRVSEFAPSEI